jgi:hypothetical protein
MYALTIYRDSSRKDITNEYDFAIYEYLDEAIEYASQFNLPYRINETHTDKIYDLEPSPNDDVVTEHVSYWVAPDCEEWSNYYLPYNNLLEAKLKAKECINREHCNVYIERHFEKLVKEG